MNTAMITECMTLSFADTPFPKVVERLVGAGVRSYTADLIKLRNTYYDDGGEAFDEPLPLKDGLAIAPSFDSKSSPPPSKPFSAVRSATPNSCAASCARAARTT